MPETVVLLLAEDHLKFPKLAANHLILEMSGSTEVRNKVAQGDSEVTLLPRREHRLLVDSCIVIQNRICNV